MDEHIIKDQLDAVQEQIDTGASMITVAEEHFDVYCRYATAIEKYYLMKRISESPNTLEHVKDHHCVWMWGATGTGKTRQAYEMYPGLFSKLLNKRWDGYQGQMTVLLDGLSKTESKLGLYIKQWADRYPFIAERKRQTPLIIRPYRIVVTSYYHPSQIWDTDQELVASILRLFRLEEFKQLPPVPPPPKLLGKRRKK